MRNAGFFLDLWHWRAHRSNPIGVSDDEFVFDVRSGDAGLGPFTDNRDPQIQQPLFMFDPDKTGKRALAWDDVIERRLGFGDLYYLSDEIAAPFDAAHAWKEGDTIPRRLLRRGDGSHADSTVFGEARWQDGYWDVTLKRAMDTGNPMDDKIMVDGRIYEIERALRRGRSVADVAAESGVDPWFVDQIALLGELRTELETAPVLDADLRRRAKRHGLSDRQLAVVRPSWPASEDWSAVLEAAAELGGSGWARWSTGTGAEQAATVLEELVCAPR